MRCCALELGFFRVGSGFRLPLGTLGTRRRRGGVCGLARDRHLRPAGQASTDQFAPAPRAVRGSLSRAGKLTKRRLPSSLASFPVTQVGDGGSGGGGNAEPQPTHTRLCAHVCPVL